MVWSHDVSEKSKRKQFSQWAPLRMISHILRAYKNGDDHDALFKVEAKQTRKVESVDVVGTLYEALGNDRCKPILL